MRAGDYSKAMQSLLKVDAKISVNSVKQTIKDSLPPRSYGDLNHDQRQPLFTRVDFTEDEHIATENDILHQLKKF